MSPNPFRTLSLAGNETLPRAWTRAGWLFCLGMLGLHIAAGFNSAGVTDFWRDAYYATRIAYGEALPLSGPPIYQLIELGPWWFYVLALPIWLTHRIVAASVLIQIFAAVKYFLAWHLGRRLVDARFGLAWAVAMAIAGWSLSPLLFPSHPAVVETTILLLAIVVRRSWQRWTIGNAMLFGLASTACLHAHPTTAPYVLVAGAALLLRHRHARGAALLAFAALIVVASLAPPWFDAEPVPDTWRKTMAIYASRDLGIDVWSRVLAFVRAIFIGGAWSGLLLLTPFKIASVRVVWVVYTACVAVGILGVFLLRGDHAEGLRRWFGLAWLALLAQILFLVCVRQTTPIWMVPSCLPPFTLALAIGFYGWLAAGRRQRGVGIAALATYAIIGIAPFGHFLRDVRSERVMTHANPFGDIGQSQNSYVTVPVPFVRIRALDAIATSLCAPSTVHARLGHALEHSLAVSLRNACGDWPDTRIAGTWAGPHIAGIAARAAAMTDIEPARSVAGMALYTNLRPIAPIVGGRPTRLRRMQVIVDASSGAPQPVVFEFETGADDVVSLTNRFADFAPMLVRSATGNGTAASLLYDDGGSRLYRCVACAPAASVHWRIELEGVEPNLDLVVLLKHAADAPAPN